MVFMRRPQCTEDDTTKRHNNECIPNNILYNSGCTGGSHIDAVTRDTNIYNVGLSGRGGITCEKSGARK